jgi:hypothetical protein
MRCGGPVWWSINREKRCSRSSCEAEIKSLDLVCKEAAHLNYLMKELHLAEAEKPIPTFNDNQGSVDWSVSGAITKRLRHMNMKEVAIRDAIAHGEVAIHHLPGKFNPSDILTKEDRDQQHFVALREVLVPSFPDMGGVGISATYDAPPSEGSKGISQNTLPRPTSVNNTLASEDNYVSTSRRVTDTRITKDNASKHVRFAENQCQSKEQSSRSSLMACNL